MFLSLPTITVVLATKDWIKVSRSKMTNTGAINDVLGREMTVSLRE